MATGYITTPVNLSPELLAKALTQVYRYDLPDYYPNPTVAGILPVLGPAWSVGNPLNISFDGQFQRLNPDSAIWNFPVTFSLAPLLTEDHSALNQQIWQWIQADPGASAWLNKGTPDLPTFDTRVEPTRTTRRSSSARRPRSTPSRAPTAHALMPAGPIDAAEGRSPGARWTCCRTSTDYDQAAADVLTAESTR